MANQVKQISKGTQAKFITVDTLEYMVSLIVGGAFLAHLTKTIGIPDSISGIISAFISLAGVSQLLTMMIVRPGKRMKGFTTALVIINQFMWALLYLIPLPFLPLTSGQKIMLFMALKLIANVLLKMCYPTKFVWQTYYVEEHKIGIYNATKEMVSLICGMVFSLGIGILSDRMEAAGRMDDSFLLCAAFIAIFSTVEGILLISVKEPRGEDGEDGEKHSISEPFRATFGSKNFRRIITAMILYHFFVQISLSFYGVYQRGELGFSMTYSQILTFAGMTAWAILARWTGRLAQRITWTKVVIIFMIICAISYGVNIFTVPSNGKVFFAIYILLHHVSSAGVRLPLLSFEYIDTANRTGAVAVTQALGGVAGFIGSLVGAAILDRIQANGNTLFGIKLYAQQVLSGITFVGMMLTVLYLWYVTKKIKKEEGKAA
ncbi:MAG: hypothetical protein IKJ91_03395 [Clostridia bacterium]|nr:hypothetical protein [Clostridia bacterium]